MSEERGGRNAVHPLLAAGPRAADAAAEALAASGLSLSRGDLRGAMVSLHSAQQALEAARLHVVRLLAAAEDPGPHPGAPTRHFLADALGIGAGAARADLEAARATDPDTGILREMGGALAAGEVTRRHVDVACRTVAALPTGMVRDERAEVDRVLTAHARAFCPTDAEKLASHLVATVAPDGIERHADEAFERRAWSARTDRTGMVRAEGALEGADGAQYLAVLHHLAAPGRAAAGCEDDDRAPADGAQQALGVGTDLRTRSQRLADAQGEMARLAAAQLKLRTPADPPRVVVHTTVEQLAQRAGTAERAGRVAEEPCPGPATCEQTGPLSSAVLQALACDAHVEKVVIDRTGAVVRMESVGRLATRTQRRALAARDGGCSWAGCAQPPAACDAHHVRWWSRGGPTELGNLALLCPRHHREAHREQWTITMRDGVPWFTPPEWLDPARTPVRNSFHTAAAATRAAGAALVRGRQLPLQLLAPGGGPPPQTDRPPDADPSPP